MNEVYVLKFLYGDSEYSEEDFIIGIFSTKEKAELAKEKRLRKNYYGNEAWVETWVIDEID